MAARTFLITVKNFILRPWDRRGLNLLHGVWSQGSDGIPSEHIPAARFDGIDTIPGEDWFMSESDGTLTGTEGWVDYTMQGVDGTLRVYWDNPFSGGNSFTAGGVTRFRYNWGDPGGSNAEINLRIESPSAPARRKSAEAATAGAATKPSY